MIFDLVKLKTRVSNEIHSCPWSEGHLEERFDSASSSVGFQVLEACFFLGFWHLHLLLYVFINCLCK